MINNTIFCLIFRSDHLSKHIKTHTKNRNGTGDPNNPKLDVDLENLDKAEIKTETNEDPDGIVTEESDEDGVLEDGEGDMEDQEQDTGEMMITINTEGEQSDLIINDQQIENQS